jgi:Uma2 family endonuclease
MPYTTTDQPRRHRLSVADYYRMAEVGILRPDERVELIEGEIIDMAPVGSVHAGTVDQMAKMFGDAVGDTAIVRAQNPISLDDHSEPEPDIALLRRRDDFYKSAHPTPDDILLVVEIADSSLLFDRNVKAPLYARHGIVEVWLVDVKGWRVTRYRNPLRGEYTLIDQPDLGTALVISAIPDARVELNALRTG